MPDIWNQTDIEQAIRHAGLLPDLSSFFQTFTAWPQVSSYASWNFLPRPPYGFAVQDAAFDMPDGGYEVYIEAEQAVPTRPENYHDFYNAICWYHFPLAKKSLHLHQCAFPAVVDSKNKRSPQQNAATLFDECGVIMLTSNPELFALLAEHQWMDVFWHRREELQKQSAFFMIGHALFEKMAYPYIGMCGKVLPVYCGQDVLLKPYQEQLAFVDAGCAEVIPKYCTHTKALSTLPLLGVPDWYSANTEQSFYKNTDYFRPKAV